jgi:formylglycine-generating enzyme required for sulfatase activity
VGAIGIVVIVWLAASMGFHKEEVAAPSLEASSAASSELASSSSEPYQTSGSSSASVAPVRSERRVVKTFRDCADGCPAMVAIPPGSFMMGSPDGNKDEGPPHEVRIQDFSVSKYPITRGEWRRYLKESERKGSASCYGFNQSTKVWGKEQERSWSNPGFQQTDNHPVICVTWQEAQDYATWLSSKTGHHYRLLSEAEYEYINRAGRQTAYPWGATSEGQCAHVNGADATLRAVAGGHWEYSYAECNDGFEFTSPVEHFPANAFGLHDTSGNVSSWTQDCYHDSYDGAPKDGSAWETEGGCGRLVIRGSSWNGGADDHRAAARAEYSRLVSSTDVGFRLARDVR